MSKNKRRIFLIVGGLLFVCLLVVAIGIGRLLAASLDAKDELSAAETSLTSLDFESTSRHLAAAQAAVGRARDGFIFLAPLRAVPGLGSRVSGLSELYTTADERLLPMLIEVVDVAKGIVQISDEASKEITNLSDLDISARVDILRRLSERQADLEKTGSQLELLARDLELLMTLPLPRSLEYALSSFKMRVPVLREQVSFLSALATILPEFGGLDQQKRFLLLYENNNELRPGGGFIGTLGDLMILNGEVVSLSSQDVYAVDGPVEKIVTAQPPAPLKQYLDVPVWFVRDANWSADGPTSLSKTLELLSAEQTMLAGTPTQYDGVIALTPSLISQLLQILGPITVANQTFTAENFTEALDYEVEYGYAEKGLHFIQRKEVIGTLTKEIVGRLMAYPLSDWQEIITAVNDAVAQKQLFLYSNDAQMQERLERMGWAGQRIVPEQGDALLVVDANLGSLKSDPAIERHLTYRVRQNEQGRLIASVSILYNHTGSFDWKTTRYRTYTRVYAPKGSELLRVKGALLDDALNNPNRTEGTADTTDELNWTTFGAFTAVEPGEQQSLEFVYYLPDDLIPTLTDGSYELVVLKQLGAQKKTLTIDVDFGTPVLTAMPAEEETQFGDSRYLLNTSFIQDLSVYVRQKVGN